MNETLVQQAGPASSAAIREWICVELAQALGVERGAIDAAAPLTSLGADSLVAISITGALAEWLDRDLPATLMWDYPSIDAIAQALGEAPVENVLPPGVILLHGGGNGSPLFCFPGAGGHSTTFAPLAARVGVDRNVYGLIVPGINGERQPLESVEEIAAEMLKTIRLVQPRGPYQLAGYSFGGLLAFEVAQRLKKDGDTVSLLAIYDTFTPDGLVLRPLWQRMPLHAYLLLAKPGRRDYIKRHLQQRRDRNAAPSKTAGTYGAPGKPARVLRTAVELVNLKASSDYVPRPYEGSIVLFRPCVRAQERIFYKYDAATNGWGALAPGRVRAVDLPGTHLTMLDAAFAPHAAARLRPFLSAGEADANARGQAAPAIPQAVAPAAGNEVGAPLRPHRVLHLT